MFQPAETADSNLIPDEHIEERHQYSSRYEVVDLNVPPLLHPQNEDNVAILRELRLLRSAVEQLVRLTQEMRSQLNAILNKNKSPVNVTLPVDTTEDFLALSDESRNKATFDQFVEFLQCSRGDTPGECIRSMMRRLLTPNVSKLINWNGIHGRIAMSDSPIKEAILEAIYVRKFPEFNRDEATRIMKKFLHKLR